MPKLSFTFTILLLLISASPAFARDARDLCTGLDQKVVNLVSEYRELRKRRTELPQGVFDHDISASGGRLSKVLSALGVEFGRPAYSKEKIVACMSAPDAVKSHKQMGHLLDIYNRELKKSDRLVEEKSDREYLIYFWRGWHDCMFFIVEDGVVVDHGWWFAYEWVSDKLQFVDHVAGRMSRRSATN
jgi:hypothetical protein